MPTDEAGMVGRLCPNPECRLYFKLRPGTGLPIDDCGCPYCGTRGSAADFLTADQLEYAKSVAMKEIVEPMLRDFKSNIEGMNRPQGRSLISIKFSVDLPSFYLHTYRETDVETPVTCSNCSLEFAVFGVFASCPDCGQLNAFDVFRSSLESCRRRLRLIDLPDTASDGELVKAIVVDALGSAVASFDALGKKLREQHPGVYPSRPKNLFQNLVALDQALTKATGAGLSIRLGPDGADDLHRLVQVRHIYEHNLGVVDDQFVANVPKCAHLRGRIYPITVEGVERLISLLGQLASSLRDDGATAKGDDGQSR